jgi:hypothetical protein
MTCAGDYLSRDQSKKLPQERGANHEDLHSTWVLHLFVIFVTAYLDIKNAHNDHFISVATHFISVVECT